MNNKIEKIVINFIYFVAACFGLSLVIFFGAEIMGSASFYSFIQDHGSLIAGLIGFGGVIWLVVNQNQATRATTDATLKAILLESNTIEKRMYKLDLVEVANYNDSIIITMTDKKGHRVYSDYKDRLCRVRDITRRLVFLIVNKDNQNRYHGLLFVQNFFIFYDELFKLMEREFTSKIDLDIGNINVMRQCALFYLRKWHESFQDENEDNNKVILMHIESLNQEIIAVPVKEHSEAEETGRYAINRYFISEMSRQFMIMDVVLKDVIKVLDSEK